jgi:hypothetical protein
LKRLRTRFSEKRNASDAALNSAPKRLSWWRTKPNLIGSGNSITEFTPVICKKNKKLNTKERKGKKT